MFSADQYEAVRERVAVIDRSARGKISLTGADRSAFLHALLTNDIARLSPGTGTYAAYLTPQGRMISDMRVAETGDEMLLDVEASVVDALAERLDKLVFSEDVQVRNVTAELGLAAVNGPLAAKVVEKATGIPGAQLEAMTQYGNVRIQDSAITVVRDDMFGVPGFDIYVPATGLGSLIDSITSGGAMPITEETAEILRIEGGRPKFGTDMDNETIPLEAGIEERAISLTKGCYVGQEVIVRVLHRGHGRVAKKLMALEIAEAIIPERGAPILAGDQQIGRITSAAFSPRRGGPLALGYVQRDHAAKDSQVTVRTGGQTLHAKVRQLGE
jgi:folate-binding protein YgfZ